MKTQRPTEAGKGKAPHDCEAQRRFWTPRCIVIYSTRAAKITATTCIRNGPIAILGGRVSGPDATAAVYSFRAHTPMLSDSCRRATNRFSHTIAFAWCAMSHSNDPPALWSALLRWTPWSSMDAGFPISSGDTMLGNCLACAGPPVTTTATPDCTTISVQRWHQINESSAILKYRYGSNISLML